MAQLSQAGKSAKERFLIAASERLITSSSTVSARLGGQYLSLVGDDRNKSNNTAQCRGCGSHLIPGWSCKKVAQNSSARIEKRKTKTAQQASERFNSPKLRFLQCDRCDTRTPISGSRKPRRPRPVASLVQASKTTDLAAVNNATPVISTGTTSEPTTNPVISNIVAEPDARTTEYPTTSKKRTRTKKTSGLQALLAQRKADVKGPGLDLMDFMRGA